MTVYTIHTIESVAGAWGWDDCKPEWQNFVNSVSERYADWLQREDTYQLIQDALLPYHGRLDCISYKVSKIIFDSEEHLNWFLLKWS